MLEPLSVELEVENQYKLQILKHSYRNGGDTKTEQAFIHMFLALF